MTWERSRRRNFNPLPSYEGRLSTSAMAQARGHFNPLPSHEGRQEREIRDQVAREFQSTPLSRGKTIRTLAIGADTFISIRSPLTRGDTVSRSIREIKRHFNPLPSHEGRPSPPILRLQFAPISIRSPHARGDSISLQKSIRIYVSLHNKTMIHRFSELYKPLFAAQSPIFGVRSPRESHDSFTFARPSAGRGITP